MAELSTVRRKLYWHPAHRTVGVSGVAAPLRSWRCVGKPSDGSRAKRPIRVSLVSRGMDGPGRAAPALFERVLRSRGNVRCRRVDFAAAAENAVPDADCVVVFSRGALLIADDWANVDVEILAEGSFGIGDEFRAEVQLASSAWGHPVVEGVKPFVSRFRRDLITHLHKNEACLFVGRTADGILPVAWACSDGGRIFRTLLGSAEDFCRPEFIRLALNALDWASSR